MNFKIQSKFKRSWCFFCALTLAWIMLSGFPGEAAVPPSSSKSSIFPNQDWQKILIQDNITLSELFDSMADGLDVFLAGKRFTKKRNDSKVVVETSLLYNEKDHFNDSTSFNVNLRLPNVEEYWQLTFTSYDETKERGLAQSYLRRTTRDQDYGATLGFFRKLGDVRAYFQPRVGFSGAFKISHTLGFESVAQTKAGYRINPKLEFYANADRGPGVFQGLYFQFPLADKFSLTWINEGDYQDRAHYLFATHGFAVLQWIDQMSSLNYGIYFNFTNEPNYQLFEYVTSVAWNRLIYKNILDIELMPYLNFNKQWGYAGYYGIIFNIRINF